MDKTRKADWPSEVAIRPAKNGGHIVRHSFDNSGRGESYRPSEEHAFSDHASMLAHVTKHTGGEAPAGMGRVSKAKAPGPKTHGAGID